MADEQFIIDIRALCSVEHPDALPFIGSVFLHYKAPQYTGSGYWEAATHARNHLKPQCA